MARPGAGSARMVWWLTQYSFGVVDAEAIARQAAQQLRGVDEEAFRAKMRNWVRADVLRHIALRARDEVKTRKAQGYSLRGARPVRRRTRRHRSPR